MPVRTQIFLIRSAESTDCQQGLIPSNGFKKPELTRFGLIQAQHLAQYLYEYRDIRFDHILVSTQRRALVTAKALQAEEAMALQGPLSDADFIQTQHYHALDEQDFGMLKGKPMSILGTIEAGVNNYGVEPQESLYARVEKFVDDVLIRDYIYVDLKNSPNSTRRDRKHYISTDVDLNIRNIAIVSHLETLKMLWTALVNRFQIGNLSWSTAIPDPALIGSHWAHAAFMELSIEGTPDHGPASFTVRVEKDNCIDPVRYLKSNRIWGAEEFRFNWETATHFKRFYNHLYGVLYDDLTPVKDDCEVEVDSDDGSEPEFIIEDDPKQKGKAKRQQVGTIGLRSQGQFS
ncbi:phosphoglycerate mutase-like protein [Ascobolus immersus RN42]|uniref:Phosphoglycerate mutase-like protein n=1 Tax=Ascobolus immersus RN42 TaxID=1160509 RepID=A0A3N4ISG1_ASCIM|nr:phosphoglycerate mutase-like protein [Ascobolus immersus RN42]